MRTRRRIFDPYVAAHQRAYAWAEKAMLSRSAAQFVEAGAAVEKVQHWLSKIARGPTSQPRHRQQASGV
jgi:hypothetical protein